MSAYIPPSRRAAPTQQRVVYDSAVVAYERENGPRYVGPCITKNDTRSGIGLVGRPHVSFWQPTRSIEGVFRISSVDDSFTVVVGGDEEYESAQGGSPNCGYHFFVKSQSCPSIGVWRKPDNDADPLRIEVPLPASFPFAEGTAVQFQLYLLEEDGKSLVHFSIAELNEGGIPSFVNRGKLVVYVPPEVIDGGAQTNRAVCENCEKGRLVFLENLVLDGEDFTAELETLTLPDALRVPVANEGRRSLADLNANPVNVPSLQSAHDVFRVNFKGGMEFETVP